jgi:hypothetical protein
MKKNQSLKNIKKTNIEGIRKKLRAEVNVPIEWK